MKRAQNILLAFSILLVLSISFTSAFWPFDWLFKGVTGSAVAEASGGSGSGSSATTSGSGTTSASGSGIYSANGKADVQIVTGNSPSPAKDIQAPPKNLEAGSVLKNIEKVEITFKRGWSPKSYLLCSETYILRTIPVNETLVEGQQYRFFIQRDFNDSLNFPVVEGPFKTGSKAKIFGGVDLEVQEASYAVTTISLSKECPPAKTTATPASNVAGAVGSGEVGEKTIVNDENRITEYVDDIAKRSGQIGGEPVAFKEENDLKIYHFVKKEIKVNHCGQEYMIKLNYISPNSTRSDDPLIYAQFEISTKEGLKSQSNLLGGNADIHFKGTSAEVLVRVVRTYKSIGEADLLLICKGTDASAGTPAFTKPAPAPSVGTRIKNFFSFKWLFGGN